MGGGAPRCCGMGWGADGGGGRLRRWGASEGWAVGDCLFAQRAIQVLKSRWLVAGWRRGTDWASPPVPTTVTPASFSAKKKSTHIQHTQAPSPQQHRPAQKHSFLHSSFKRTSNVPRTHTSAHTSAHMPQAWPQTHTHTHSHGNSQSSPILTSPIHSGDIFSNVPHARPCSWSPLANVTHRTYIRTLAHMVCTRRPSYTKHALMLIIPCSPVKHPHATPSGPHLPALPLPTPLPPHRQRHHM